MPKAGRRDRTAGTGTGPSYTPIATSLRFDLSALTLTGAAGATYTDLARVYDQFGVLMNPRPSGTISYSSGSGGIATVNSSTGLLTSVADGQSVITATFTPAGGGGTTFVSDTFTDTATTTLASHTGETGAIWTPHPSYSASAVISNANRLRQNGVTTTAYYASGVPATADYDVSCVLNSPSLAPAEANGVCGRMDTSANTFYHARYSSVSGRWEIFRFVAGTATSLGTFNQVLTINTDYALKLEMRASAINLYVDGVLRVSASDSGISAAGRAGVRLAYTSGTPSDTAGLHVDTFAATDA